MNRSWIVGLGLMAATVAPGAAPIASQTASEAPKLVVLISVDQFRADLVERYAPMFTGGFKRFRDDGYRFTEMSHAHAATETAVGHATLSTGVLPSRSGIVANDWTNITADGAESMYAVEDLGAPIVGYPDLPGRSPKNLLRGGLADWVLAADAQARVASVSLKDRAAITLAGKTKGEVYWINTSAGRFVTSTYYHTEYPGWVQRFNDQVMPGLLSDSVWASTVPEQFRSLARQDAAPYEGDGTHTTFPHRASEEAPGGNRVAWLLRTSAADKAVGAMAREAVNQLQLGQRGHQDYLGISFSATDYVGHAYGPLSQEQLENVHRLDLELGSLFDYLDEHVGRGRWVAGLSADHGVVTMPEYLEAEGQGGHRINSRTRGAALRKAAEDAQQAGGTKGDIARRLVRILEDRGLVAKAYADEDLTKGVPADSFATLFRNSMYPGRAGGPLSPFGVEIRFGYHDLVSNATGTSHGSPYWYDRHVPFLLLGAGVGHGMSDRGVYTVDVAPTLAALAGISVPADLDGHSIYR